MYIHNTEQNKEPDIKLRKMFFASEVRSYHDDKKKSKWVLLSLQNKFKNNLTGYVETPEKKVVTDLTKRKNKLKTANSFLDFTAHHNQLVLFQDLNENFK